MSCDARHGIEFPLGLSSQSNSHAAQEAHMKKLYILAALLMASTTAHAGNSISFDIEGHHIHVAVPRNCNSLSCLQISAPGLSGSNFGFKSKHADDDDIYTNDSPAPAQYIAPAPAPAAQDAAPQPVAP